MYATFETERLEIRGPNASKLSTFGLLDRRCMARRRAVSAHWTFRPLTCVLLVYVTSVSSGVIQWILDVVDVAIDWPRHCGCDGCVMLR